MDAKICVGCNESKAIEEFNWKSERKGKRHARCKACTRLQVKEHYEANTSYYIAKALRRNRVQIEIHRQRILNYLMTHSCVDCGESDAVCLEFDHVRGTKLGTVGSMLGDYPWEKIQAEIDKCEVRCANCHRRRTGLDRMWYRSMATA